MGGNGPGCHFSAHFHHVCFQVPFHNVFLRLSHQKSTGVIQFHYFKHPESIAYKLVIRILCICPCCFRKEEESAGRDASRPSASLVATITSPTYPGPERFFRYALTIAGQAKFTHEIDETCCDVPTPAILTGCIIIGERMVVVVETFTWRQKEKLSERRLLEAANPS